MCGHWYFEFEEIIDRPSVCVHDGRLIHSEVQDGGPRTLFDGAIPDMVRSALLAGLMASGPNRPTRLSGFTPADTMTGSVTGHRKPIGTEGTDTPLNARVLDAMTKGADPAGRG